VHGASRDCIPHQAGSLEVTRSFSVFAANRVSPYWLSDPPTSLMIRTPSRRVASVDARTSDPGVFPGLASADGVEPTPPRSAHGVAPPSELDRRQATATNAAAFAVPLMRFVPLQRMKPWRSTESRACLTRLVPPPGFLTLLTACSLHGRPALFHAGGTHGVVPFRAFPSGRSRSASRRPQPSWR
jgi:hypothetical protein